MSDDERDRSDEGGRRRSLESGGDFRSEGMDKGRGEGSQPRTRTMMSPAQLAGLHSLWNQVSGNDPITKFPTTAQREALAQKIGLTPRKVQVWFQNQRQKHRRVELQQSSESPTSSSSSSTPFPPSSSSHQHPPHPLTASVYVYPPLADVSEPPLSSDQTARRPSSYDPHSLPPPHPLSAAALPPSRYPNYYTYPQHPPPPPNLPHHTSYFPRNPNDPSYPSHRLPTAQDPDERQRAKYSHISPPMAIQLRRSSDEKRLENERRERERRMSGDDRDQEMRDESLDARRNWERGRVASGGERGEGSSGWYNVATAVVPRRVSEGEADTMEGGGPSGWSSEHGRPIRYASFPGSASSSSYYNTSTPRQNTYPTFYDPPFTPLARPPPHERLPSSHGHGSPMQLFSPSRSAPPPSFSRLSSSAGSQKQPSPPPQHLPPLEEKPISPLSSTSISPLAPATALPSFRDFLYTTSTTSNLLPSSLPSTAPPITTAQFAPQRSNYASSTNSSSNSYQTYPRRPSSASSRGIGGANEAEAAGGKARTGRTHTSSSSSSQPRSPTSSSCGGGNRGLPLPPPSALVFTTTSPSNLGLTSSSLGTNESFSRSTLGSPLFPPPSFDSSVPFLAHRSHSISGSSSVSSSSQRNPPTTPSLFNAFSGSDRTPAMFTALPLSREGSLSDPSSSSSSSNNSATAKQVSPALSAETTVGIELESMEIDEEGRGRGGGGGAGELEGGGGGLGARALPGMLDVVGFGGNVGLGKFSVSGGSTGSR